jgi:hypothetical protein
MKRWPGQSPLCAPIPAAPPLGLVRRCWLLPGSRPSSRSVESPHTFQDCFFHTTCVLDSIDRFPCKYIAWVTAGCTWRRARIQDWKGKDHHLLRPCHSSRHCLWKLLKSAFANLRNSSLLKRCILKYTELIECTREKICRSAELGAN